MLPNQSNNLKIVSDCPVCRRKRFAADVKLVGEQADGHLLHVKCKNCQSCTMILVSPTGHGMNMLGVLTDLGSEEVGKFMDRGSLSSDDMIGLHEILQKEEFAKQINS